MGCSNRCLGKLIFHDPDTLKQNSQAPMSVRVSFTSQSEQHSIILHNLRTRSHTTTKFTWHRQRRRQNKRPRIGELLQQDDARHQPRIGFLELFNPRASRPDRVPCLLRAKHCRLIIKTEIGPRTRSSLTVTIRKRGLLHLHTAINMRSYNL